MKRKKVLCLLLCLCLSLQCAMVTKAAQVKEGAVDWRLSQVDLSHTSVSFQISNVEQAQDAKLMVKEYRSTTVICEVPFSIGSATEKKKLTLPEGVYFKGGTYYTFTVMDSSGNETADVNGYMTEHSVYPDCYAYPKGVLVKNLGTESIHISATVAFQEYKADIEAGGQKLIEYPTQVEDTTIVMKWWDDYECSRTWYEKVKNEYLYFPTISVVKDCINVLYGSSYLGEYNRLAAEVEGVVYYSDYGLSKKSSINHAITFPQVKEDTKSVKVWVESKNGSKSSVKDYAVEECALSGCKKSCLAYLSQATGKVEPSTSGATITRVTTNINNVVYSCDVKADGTYVLNYPEQEFNKTITITFWDKHGCSTSDETWVRNDMRDSKPDIYAFLSRAYVSYVYAGARVAVKIGEQIYYSEYAKEAGSLEVTYPKQSPGQVVSAWYEKENTSKSKITQSKIKSRLYKITADVRTASISGRATIAVKSYTEVSTHGDCQVFVIVDGRHYECSTNKTSERDYDDDGYKKYVDFKCQYPKQKLGSKVTVLVKDKDGYENSKEFVMKNMEPMISVKRVNTSTTRLRGKTAAKAKLTVKIGKKKYYLTTKSDGSFSLKIPAKKSGTKITISVLSTEGYYNTKTVKVAKEYGYAELASNVFRGSKKVNGYVYMGKKGDKVKVKIGKKTYTKKIKSNKDKQKVSIKIKSATAGSSIRFTLYDKYGKKKGASPYSDIVYYGKKINIGMSSKNATLTIWGKPVRRNNWGTGYLQWVYKSGGSTLYAYIKGGKVCRIQQMNY